jgi:hypothetical protein
VALLGVALPVLVLALACAGFGEDDADADAVEDRTASAAAAAAASGAVTTATPTPESTLAPDLEGEDLAVAVWGEQVCALTRTFATDFLASGDPRDPQELPLDERKQRADAMFPVQMETVNAALGQLALIDPPNRTAELHALLRQTYQGLLQSLGDQRVIIEAADSTEEIAFSNIEVDEWINLAFRQAALLQNAGYC